MKTNTRSLARSLVDACEGLSATDLQKQMKTFVSFLGEQGLLGQWRSIERDIHAVWKEKYGVSVVNVVSAHTLTDTARTTLQGLVHGADIKTRVDERLIGGAVIRIDDERMDGSIAGSLRRLKAHLET